MIDVHNISKAFRVVKRRKGIVSAAKAMFRREYKTIQALDQVSFHVDKGEILGFIGPNGAGKSTAIKVMSGILVPDSGECRIMGMIPWKNRKQYVSQIGVVFGHRMQLWWDVPVRDSFDLLRDIYKIPEADFKCKLSQLTDIFEIGDLLYTPLRQMSLGQRMRCEIAASLLHDPSVLFLDEPTIGLDAVSKLATRKLVKDLNTELGVTVILTTHDMDDIEAVTDRILMIGKGNILYDGSMRKIREEYDQVRTLTVSFAERETAVVPEGAELADWHKTRAVYKVDSTRTNVAHVIKTLGEQLSVFDITVETRSIEAIIADFYRAREV